jgi:C1A family cysteine protease
MHKLNWKRDLPDFRDIHYSSNHHVCKLEMLPPSVDLRSKCSPVENQDQLGSCTSFALAGALEFLEEQDLSNKVASPEIISTGSYSTFSHLFIYYNERAAEGTVNQDGGGMLRDGIKTLASLGAAPEILWPYDESKVFIKPSSIAYAEALKHQITAYIRLDTIADMKHCLAAGFPFVFGFTVYEAFESSQVATSGIVPMPNLYDECMGGHAVLAVGYDDGEQMFLIRNSWGSGWGLSGYFKLPYAYVSNPNLASDFWTIRR